MERIVDIVVLLKKKGDLPLKKSQTYNIDSHIALLPYIPQK